MKYVTLAKPSTIPGKTDIHQDLILLESESDFEKWKQLQQEQFDRSVKFLMRCGVQPERWDHMIHTLESQFLRASLAMTGPLTVIGANLWVHAADLAATLYVSVEKMLQQGPVLINQEGAASPLGAQMWDEYVISLPYEQPRGPLKYVSPVIELKPGSTVICLENDPTLEPVAKLRLDAKFVGPYSYLCSLRMFSDWDLRSNLKKFHSDGGTTVYVYTSGLDVDQMKWYIDIALKVGLRKFVFEWSSGTPEFRGFHPLDYIADAGARYTVLN